MYLDFTRLYILLTRICNVCSYLDADLNRVNLTDSPVCNCGNPCEDAYHLMECPNITRHRIILFDKLRNFEPLSVVKLLFGDFNSNINDNKTILLSQREYILKQLKDLIIIVVRVSNHLTLSIIKHCRHYHHHHIVYLRE